MSQKELKEAFVRNLNGTSLQEVSLGSSLAPVCLIIRGLILIICYLIKGSLPLPLPHVSHLLLDFSALILPLVLSCTILSSVLYHVIISLVFVVVCVTCCLFFKSKHPQNTVSSFLQSHIESKQVPFVTLFRVFVNVKTAISILAVDFAVFPRRYAKTETYGTGVMDFGVGAYIFANALVCPEARGKSFSGSRLNHVKKQLLSVWPLVVLGMGRLVSVKMSGYHEHVTEYGVHWNFFFTLAIVRVVVSLLLSVFPARLSWVYAVLISGLYQFVLETSELKDFILYNNDRDKDFLHANKEGIFSVVGNVALYLAGVQVGLYVMKPRSLVQQWFQVLFNLLFACFVLFAALWACQTLLEPVSRCLANLPFFIWSVAQSLLFLSCIGFADMALLFSKRSSGYHFVPSSWNLCKKQSDSEQKTAEMEGLCLVQAVSRNQLLFFLLANVMTGLTNYVMDTLSCSHLFSVCVLLLYMFINCFVIYLLHVCEITIKFW
ncbi:phosphatidylinositol-glycan biosynthesis class W protein isoform X2 [Halichoeres trimaculatus]